MCLSKKALYQYFFVVFLSYLGPPLLWKHFISLLLSPEQTGGPNKWEDWNIRLNEISGIWKRNPILKNDLSDFTIK